MQPRSRAHLSAGLGIAAMLLATGGCVTCGVTYVLALGLGVFGFMLARPVVVGETFEEGPETAALAWARVGAWTSGLGGGFSLIVVLLSVISLAFWALGGLAVVQM